MGKGPKVGTTATFKKGTMVRVKPEIAYGGEVRKDYHTGAVVYHSIWRDRTDEDHDAWRASDASKGMDSAGESKLDSPSRWRQPAEGEIFKVTRARVSAPRGWWKIKGCAEVVDTEGISWYVERKHLH